MDSEIVVFNETLRLIDEYNLAGKTPPPELIAQIKVILNESVYTE